MSISSSTLIFIHFCAELLLVVRLWNHTSPLLSTRWTFVNLPLFTFIGIRTLLGMSLGALKLILWFLMIKTTRNLSFYNHTLELLSYQSHIYEVKRELFNWKFWILHMGARRGQEKLKVEFDIFLSKEIGLILCFLML